MTGASEELKKIYADAWTAGIWLAEWKGIDSLDSCWAAAGSLRMLKETEEKLGWPIDLPRLTLIQVAQLGAVPAEGKTREKACRSAIAAYKAHRARQ